MQSVLNFIGIVFGMFLVVPVWLYVCAYVIKCAQLDAEAKRMGIKP